MLKLQEMKNQGGKIIFECGCEVSTGKGDYDMLVGLIQDHGKVMGALTWELMVSAHRMTACKKTTPEEKNELARMAVLPLLLQEERFKDAEEITVRGLVYTKEEVAKARARADTFKELLKLTDVMMSDLVK